MKTKKSKSPLALIKRVDVYPKANGNMLFQVLYRVSIPGLTARLAIADKVQALINAAVKKANGNAK